MTKLLIDEAGWIKSVEKIPSPNFDARPDNSEIKLVVVHGISLPPGEFGGGYIQHFFCNQLDANAHEYFASICSMRVSAHCLIERNGRILQFVSFLDRAWHAGASEWQGKAACNDFSIGVELEGCDELAYDQSQYHALAEIWAALRQRYPGIRPDAITGHSDIAPGRKTDPGEAFDWGKLKKILV